MSTILKALRRLEEEKQAQAAERDLREAVAAREASASRAPARARAALVALGLVTLLAGVAVGGWWWGSARSLPVTTTAEPTAPQSPESSRSVASAPSRPAPTQPAAESIRPRAPRSGAAEPPAVAAPPPDPRGARAPAPANESGASAPDSPVVESPRVQNAGQAQVIELDRVDASVLLVSSTVWHPSAERRSARVTLEGEGGARELREGDEMGEFTVLEIEPTGVTFSRRGLRFHRKVGER